MEVVPKSLVLVVVPKQGQKNIDYELFVAIEDLGYTETIKVLNETEFNTVFRLPISNHRKIPKRELAKIIKDKYPRPKGCPRDIVLQHCKLIHGNFIDFDNSEAELKIKGVSGKMDCKCNVCEHKWSPLIGGLLQGKGCPECSGMVGWSLERFLRFALRIHGDKYDYSEITEAHITGEYARIPIRCKECSHRWEPVLNHHIHNKTGCPVCKNSIPWTLESLTLESQRIHGDKFDLSENKPEDIKGARGYIKIRCKICEYRWSTRVSCHINNKSGCPKCTSELPLTYKEVIERIREINGNSIDLSHIKESDIKGCNSRIYLICNHCTESWTPLLRSILYGKSGCPHCKKSIGEKLTGRCLEKLNIQFDKQVRLESIPTRSFDFGFKINTRKWLLEFDGIQHFKFVPYFFDNDITRYEKSRESDIIKTREARKEDYNVIRIDYKQIKNIKYHIEKAIELCQPLYVSTPTMYGYIMDNL